MTYIRGSAMGARVLGAIIGAGATLATLIGGWGAIKWWLGIPLFPLYIFWMVRPWFLGVWQTDCGILVQSWFRRYWFARGEVARIEIVKYYGMVGVSPMGWLPIVGRVGMVQIETVQGKVRDFPVTLARRNSALRLARRMCESLGLKPL